MSDVVLSRHIVWRPIGADEFQRTIDVSPDGDAVDVLEAITDIRDGTYRVMETRLVRDGDDEWEVTLAAAETTR